MSQQLSIIEKNQDKFVAIYQAVHKVNDQDAKNFFEVEKFNFLKQIEDNESLKKCSELSKVGVFLEVISNGLSFDKSNKHVYLMPRNVKLGENWETRLTYSYAADGIIYLCTSASSIISCSSPLLVYDCDHIVIENIDGQTKVNHKPMVPRKADAKIIGGYCSVLTKQGREVFFMDINEVKRLAGFSAKQNKGKASELYTSGENGQIDEGFFRTKIVKAALKNYRKKRTLTDNEYVETVNIENVAEIPPFIESNVESATEKLVEAEEIPLAF